MVKDETQKKRERERKRERFEESPLGRVKKVMFAVKNKKKKKNKRGQSPLPRKKTRL